MTPLLTRLNDLEGHFFLFETFLIPVARKILHQFANIARRAVPL